MRNNVLRSTVLSALVASSALPAFGVSYTESDFTTWTSLPVVSFVPEMNVSVSATGGNPGSYLRIQAPSDDPLGSFIYDSAGGFTWDPASGAPGITGISMDILEVNAPNAGIFLTLGALQDGHVFIAPIPFDFALGNDNIWRTSSDGGAPIPVDGFFVNLDAAFGGPGSLYLDVSQTGSPITFGLVAASEVGGLDSDIGIDNFQIDVVAVPEAGTSVSLLAMGLLGLLGFRSRWAKA